MKKITFLSFVFILLFQFSCKKEKQTVTENNEEVKNYIVDTKNSVIQWTAYKTTEKIPVAGIFKEVHIMNQSKAASPAETLNNLEFEIPVSSIFSNDSIRDFKLVTYFFGVMENTLKLKGKITTKENGQGNIQLTMNGLTKELPFFYEVKGEDIDLNAVMQLDTWQAQAAINSLNKVCYDMHKSSDGISKTWSDVTLNIQVKTKLAP